MPQLCAMPLLAELDHVCGAGCVRLRSISISLKSLGSAGERNRRGSRELDGNLNKSPESTISFFYLHQSWIATMRNKVLTRNSILLNSAPLLALCDTNACAGLAPEGFQPPGRNLCRALLPLSFTLTAPLTAFQPPACLNSSSSSVQSSCKRI